MLQNSTSTAAEGVIGSETLDKIQLAKDIAEFSGQIVYSKRYNDNKFEYRYVLKYVFLMH
jgi:urease alpha subunit